MPAHQKILYPVYTHIHATPNYTFLQPPDSAPPPFLTHLVPGHWSNTGTKI